MISDQRVQPSVLLSLLDIRILVIEVLHELLFVQLDSQHSGLANITAKGSERFDEFNENIRPCIGSGPVNQHRLLAAKSFQ